MKTMKVIILALLMTFNLMGGIAQAKVTLPPSQSEVKQIKSEDPVKKSKTGICHAPGTTYYARTKNFTPFKTLDECLKSGGRLPKR